MLEQIKLTRADVLKELNITEDTLSLYEHELELSSEPSSNNPLEVFTSEEAESIKLFHKLRESGLTYNEIKLLTSFAAF
jgi:DNA-binding transcriptional MerR regulator